MVEADNLGQVVVADLVLMAGILLFRPYGLLILGNATSKILNIYMHLTAALEGDFHVLVLRII